MNNQSKKTVTVTLPMDLYDQLKANADEDFRSVSNYIRQVLKLHVQAQENNPSG